MLADCEDLTIYKHTCVFTAETAKLYKEENSVRDMSLFHLNFIIIIDKKQA